MPLTTTQQQSLKADVAAAADPECQALEADPTNADKAFAVAALYNQAAAPAFVVWRTNVPVKDAKQAMVWTEFIGRSQGERDAWQFMLSNGILNAADANVRQGILDIFSGPSGAQSRANLTAIAKRNATRAEKVMATGTGSNASPATMGFEGSLSYQDVLAAMQS